MNEQNNKFKNLIFDKYVLNINFSLTIAHRDFKSCLRSLHTHLEGTASQIFDIGLGCYFMSKNGKHFVKCVFSFVSPLKMFCT